MRCTRHSALASRSIWKVFMPYIALLPKQTELARQACLSGGSLSRRSIPSSASTPRQAGRAFTSTQVRMPPQPRTSLHSLHSSCRPHCILSQSICICAPSICTLMNVICSTCRLHALHCRRPQGRIGCHLGYAFPPDQREPGLSGPVPLGAQLDCVLGQPGACLCLLIDFVLRCVRTVVLTLLLLPGAPRACLAACCTMMRISTLQIVTHSATFDFWPHTRHALRATPHGEKPISVEEFERGGKVAKDRQVEIWRAAGHAPPGQQQGSKPRGYND